MPAIRSDLHSWEEPRPPEDCHYKVRNISSYHKCYHKRYIISTSRSYYLMIYLYFNASVYLPRVCSVFLWRSSAFFFCWKIETEHIKEHKHVWNRKTTCIQVGGSYELHGYNIYLVLHARTFYRASSPKHGWSTQGSGMKYSYTGLTQGVNFKKKEMENSTSATDLLAEEMVEKGKRQKRKQELAKKRKGNHMWWRKVRRQVHKFWSLGCAQIATKRFLVVVFIFYTSFRVHKNHSMVTSRTKDLLLPMPNQNQRLLNVGLFSFLL